MTYLQILKHFGGLSKAAGALGYDRQRIFGWKALARIPTDDQIRIEIATCGGLRANLPKFVRASPAVA